MSSTIIITKLGFDSAAPTKGNKVANKPRAKGVLIFIGCIFLVKTREMMKSPLVWRSFRGAGVFQGGEILDQVTEFGPGKGIGQARRHDGLGLGTAGEIS